MNDMLLGLLYDKMVEEDVDENFWVGYQNLSDQIDGLEGVITIPIDTDELEHAREVIADEGFNYVALLKQALLDMAADIDKQNGLEVD
jgi:hypothetical protein